MIKKLSITEIEYLAFSLAQEFMVYNEPIPDFTTRFPNILESCLLVPFQTFDRKPAYKGFNDKAAILFYLMIKNHPFQNGNKRIAMTALFVFLHKNKKWLKVDQKELYNFAVWVAESPPKLKTETVQAIGHFLRTYLVNLD
ncbi:MAG: type II toxin-antitoxin system death-on-curing family toxin [Candidatus Azambacteria bacterium]|nr:type II toxin-antitoxin system death-on-curing family toxin [Candidatus Azambacteria bacterium]